MGSHRLLEFTASLHVSTMTEMLIMFELFTSRVVESILRHRLECFGKLLRNYDDVTCSTAMRLLEDAYLRESAASEAIIH